MLRRLGIGDRNRVPRLFSSYPDTDFETQLAVVEADEARPLIAALESNFMRLWAHRVGTHNKSTDKGREKMRAAMKSSMKRNDLGSAVGAGLLRTSKRLAILLYIALIGSVASLSALGQANVASIVFDKGTQ